MPIFILFAIAVIVGMSQSKKTGSERGNIGYDNEDDVTPRPQPIPFPKPKPKDETLIQGFDNPKTFRLLAKRAKAAGNMKAAADYNRKAEDTNLAIRIEKRRAARIAS